MGRFYAHWFGLAVGHAHLCLLSPHLDTSVWRQRWDFSPLHSSELSHPLWAGNESIAIEKKYAETISLGNESIGREEGILVASSQDPGTSDPVDDVQYTFLLMTAVGLVILAGLMSGLTLGLMSLGIVDLEVMKRSGAQRERDYADRIMSVVTWPHRLLVTLLLVNAAASEALPLVLDRLTDPVTAVLLSVGVILVFGEILPQAACSRYGLEIGAFSAPFVRFLMLLAAPIAIPIAWLLDQILGHERTALFRRTQLRALVDLYRQENLGGELTSDEVLMIQGALDLTNKSAAVAMTPLEVVTMLSEDDVLNAGTLTRILASGHSRVPVHRAGNRQDIIGLILVKELILIDPNADVKVFQVKIRPIPKISAATKLYDMLKLFQLGKSHMVVLTDLNHDAQNAVQFAKNKVEEAVDYYSISEGDEMSESESDMETGTDTAHVLARGVKIIEQMNSGYDFDTEDIMAVGIITIEDVIEELLGTEILDETDAYVDNLHLQRVDEWEVGRGVSSLPSHLRKALWLMHAPRYSIISEQRLRYGSSVAKTSSPSLNAKGSLSFHAPRMREDVPMQGRPPVGMMGGNRKLDELPRLRQGKRIKKDRKTAIKRFLRSMGSMRTSEEDEITAPLLMTGVRDDLRAMGHSSDLEIEDGVRGTVDMGKDDIDMLLIGSATSNGKSPSLIRSDSF